MLKKMTIVFLIFTFAAGVSDSQNIDSLKNLLNKD